MRGGKVGGAGGGRVGASEEDAASVRWSQTGGVENAPWSVLTRDEAVLFVSECGERHDEW